MALKFSQGVVNQVATGMGWGEVIKNCTCVVYSGNQPASPEVAATAGTELVRFTSASGALTSETRAALKITLAGASGSVSSIKVGGIELLTSSVSFTTDLDTTAALIIANINANTTLPNYYATVGGTIGSNTTTYPAVASTFYILAPKNSGASYNGATAVPVSATSTTMTVAINGGVAGTAPTGYFNDTGSIAGVAAVNGLLMTSPASAGVITKSGTWSGTATQTGTAGWFRLLCTPQFDTGVITLNTTGDAAQIILRIDGTIGTSGADMLVSATSITSAVSQTVTTFALTVPAA